MPVSPANPALTNAASAVGDALGPAITERVTSEAGRELAGRAAEGAERLSHAVQNLPLTAHGVAALALLGGAVLWLAGGKVVKPSFAVIGGAAGGLAGSVALPALGWTEVFGFPAPAAGLVLGGLVGIMLAASAFRVVMGVTGAIALGLIGLMVGMTQVEYTPATDDADTAMVDGQFDGPFDTPALAEADALEPLSMSVVGDDDRPWRTFVNDDGTEREPTPEELEANDQLRAAVDASRAFVDATAASLSEKWSGYEPDDRLRIAGYGAAGLLLGFLAGINLPKRSAAVVTALAGAGVILFAGGWLTIAMDLPGQALLSMEPQRLLVVWAVLGAIGLGAQLVGMGRSRKKSGGEDSE